jgi:hypothetical protein
MQASARPSFARVIKASSYLLAREERRLAVARGMWRDIDPIRLEMYTGASR